MAPDPNSTLGRTAASTQAALVAVSFAALLAGTNAVNPLLPVYRDLLDLEPILLSLTFVSYVTVLVFVLLLLARPRFARRAAPLLLTGMAIAIGSDLLLAHAAEWSLLLGRAVAGVAGGLATGAAAALVVAAIGAQGRALAATGNLVGAVLGTAASQFIVTRLADASPQAVALGHATIVTALLLATAIVLWLRRAINRSALDRVVDDVASVRIDAHAVRMLATGCVGWVGVSVAIVFGATIFADLDQPIVRAAGPALLLGASAVAQLMSPGIARIAPWASGLLAMAVGAAGVIGGAALRIDALALPGFALLGVGIGLSYRAGLVTLTRGAAPARHGALSSLYAAVTYAAAALVVLSVGWVGNATGVVPAALGALALTGVLALATLLWAPRLRDTVDHTARAVRRGSETRLW
ncbi:MFS transporter [Microbacterium tumbae]